MNKEHQKKAESIRLDLGDGQCVESDLPSRKVLRAIEHCRALMEAGKHVSSAKDIRAFTTMMKWLDDQHRKHGGVKPAGEETAARTISLSPEAKAVFEAVFGR
jgi:hypothetical protein